MRKNYLSIEFLFQLSALLISFILVHGVYITIIRPAADEFLEKQRAIMAEDPSHQEQSNFYIVLRDYEQEACIILMLWATAIMGWKAALILKQQNQLGQDLLKLPAGLPIGPEDTRELQNRLSELPESAAHFLLPRALRTAIQRFAATRNVQDAATAVNAVCEAEGARQEAELSIIRYIAWAIPSIGFIGTVRGIGAALAHANRAVEGDITGITQNLGVAFNSTFIALILSIILMFLIHQLQLIQERLVLDTAEYCDTHLISRMRSRPLS